MKITKQNHHQRTANPQRILGGTFYREQKKEGTNIKDGRTWRYKHNKPDAVVVYMYVASCKLTLEHNFCMSFLTITY